MKNYYPLVSILIPVYNRQEFIGQCIDSALNQDYPNLEIVVVDNCSLDSTFEVARSYLTKDSRIRVYRNSTNIGPVFNWLECLKKASGEYIKFLFSDDILLPDCVFLLMEGLLSDQNIGLAYSASLIGPTLENSIIYYQAAETESIDSLQFARRMLVNRAPYSPCAAIVRRTSALSNLHTHFETTEPHHFDRHGAGPDCMLLLLTAREFGKVFHVNKPLVYFRSHSGSFTAANMKNQISLAYLASLSFYAKRYMKTHDLLGFLFLNWLGSIRSSGWVNPIRYFKAREANGNVLELFVAVFASIPLLRDRRRRAAELRAANPRIKI